MLAVVSKMAPLAKSREILISAMLRDVVKVRDSQNDLATGESGRLTVTFYAPPSTMKTALSGALALPAGPFKANPLGDCLPVRRVSAEVLFLDRHLKSLSRGCTGAALDASL
jgi:hypothetical protein